MEDIFLMNQPIMTLFIGEPRLHQVGQMYFCHHQGIYRQFGKIFLPWQLQGTIKQTSRHTDTPTLKLMCSTSQEDIRVKINLIFPQISSRTAKFVVSFRFQVEWNKNLNLQTNIHRFIHTSFHISVELERSSRFIMNQERFHFGRVFLKS